MHIVRAGKGKRDRGFTGHTTEILSWPLESIHVPDITATGHLSYAVGLQKFSQGLHT